MDTGNSGDLIGILNALDRFDLRNDAHMVVARLHVVSVILVQAGVVDSWCECPWTEGTMAKRCCWGLLEDAGRVWGGRTVVDFLDHVFDLLCRLNVRDDDSRSASIKSRGQRELVVLGHADDY